MATTLNQYDYANIFTTYVDDNGYSFYNLFNNINIDGDVDPSLYSEDYIYSHNSWYQLAYKYYGTTRLWWILLVINNVNNPFDVNPGTKIKILNKEVVTQILSQINNK